MALHTCASEKRSFAQCAVHFPSQNPKIRIFYMKKLNATLEPVAISNNILCFAL